MARISRITTFLLAGSLLPLLAACGASDIASPGDGTVVPAPTPGPTPTPPPTGGTGNQAITSGTDARLRPLAELSPAVASLVSSQGFVDLGAIEFGGAATAATGGASPSATGASTAYRVVRIPNRITSNTTLPYVAGVAYVLDGETNVGSDLGGSSDGGTGPTLTIEPGVVIFGDNGENSSLVRVTADASGTLSRSAKLAKLDGDAQYNGRGSDFLIVNRGSKINADGTATRPIIFTARQNLEGTAVDTGVSNAQGFWGGIILAGRAPVSDCQVGTDVGGSAACYKIVEGSAASRYGGNVATDSSGVMRYVQIRYSGILVSANNELQGLTPAGAGSGTVLDHIHVHNSADDGIEIFGGRVNAKHLVITGSDDDDLDTDVGYQGAIQFVLGIKRTGNGSSDPRSFEGDSNANPDFTPRHNIRFANFTFYNPLTAATPANAAGLFLRGGMDATMVNGIIKTDVATTACVDIDAAETIRAADPALQDQGPPRFHSIYFECARPFGDDGTRVTSEAIAALFTAGTNNVTNGTAALVNVFLPNGAAATTTPFDASTLNLTGETFLVKTDYIGAVKDANDNWYKGWTCTPAYIPNMGGLGPCTAIPSFS